MREGSGRWVVLGLGVLGMLAAGACKRDKSDERAKWEIQSHYQKGNQALGQGDLEQAEREYRKTISLDPQRTGAYVNLARVLMARAKKDKPDAKGGLLSEAVKLLQKAIVLEPRGKIGLKQLAQALLMSGQAERAIDAYSKLVEIDAHDVESYLAMAAIRMKQNALEKAEKIFRQGLDSIKPGQAGFGALALAYARFMIGQKGDQRARKMLEGIGQKQPQYYEALDELGAIAARQGRFDDARRIYQSMVEINPRDYMVFELLAAIDERQGKLEAAEQNYRKSLNVDRAHMSAWTGLGRCLRAQGKKDQATYALRKADGFLGRNPAGAMELVEEVLALGDKAWARSVLERAKLASDDDSLKERLQRKLDGLSQKGSHK